MPKSIATPPKVRGQQFYATVRLIKALGGGWTASQLRAEAPGQYPFIAQAKLPSGGGTSASDESLIARAEAAVALDQA